MSKITKEDTNTPAVTAKSFTAHSKKIVDSQEKKGARVLDVVRQCPNKNNKSSTSANMLTTYNNQLSNPYFTAFKLKYHNKAPE